MAIVTTADSLREKAAALRPALRITPHGNTHYVTGGWEPREAVLLDLLADYVDAMDDAGCETESRPVSTVSVAGERPHTVGYSTAFERVHKDGCRRCSLLARIEEIA